MFLLVLFFFTTLRDWLLTNFYYNLFDLSGVSTPIIDFFISSPNMEIILFIWFLLIILVNQFEPRNIFKDPGGRVEE